MNGSLHLWLIPLLPFEVTSVLILIAILGAVALARHGDGDNAPALREKVNGK